MAAPIPTASRSSTGRRRPDPRSDTAVEDARSAARPRIRPASTPTATVRRRSSTRSRTGGTARRSTAATGNAGPAAQPHRRQAHAHRRRHAATRPRSGIEDTGFSRNWWVGLGDAAHAVRARAQRDLRPARRRRTRTGTTTRLFRRRAPRQRRRDGEDPHGGVDAGDPAEPHLDTACTRTGTGCSPTCSAASARSRRRPSSTSPTASSAGSSATRCARSPLRAERGVHRGLPPALAAAGLASRLRRRDGRGRRPTSPLHAHPARGLAEPDRAHGMDEPRVLLGHSAPGRAGHNNYPRVMLDTPHPRSSRCSTWAPSTSSATASAACRRYNEFRRRTRPEPRSARFDDLTEDPRSRPSCGRSTGEMSTADRVERLDLLVGTLCEGHRPSGFGFGETHVPDLHPQRALAPARRPLLHRRLPRGLYTPEGSTGSTTPR